MTASTAQGEADRAAAESSSAVAISPSELSQLIGFIYAGPLEPTPWASVLRWLNQHFDTDWSALVLRPASREQPALMIEAQGQMVRIATAEYVLHYQYSMDPFAHLPPDRVVTPEDVMNVESWRNSEFFQRYLQPLDIKFLMGADFAADEVAECRIRLCRSQRAGAFSTSDKALCQLLLPHFKAAVQQHSYLYRVEAERTLYAGTLDRMHLGIVILDPSGAVLTTNAIAEQLIARRDGLYLRGNTLHACTEARDVTLQTLVRQVLERAREGLPVTKVTAVDRPQGRDLGILVKTMPRVLRIEGSRKPSVAIFIRDPQRKSIPSGESLRMLFNLTPAEIAFAVLLAEGLSLDEAGDRLGISKNTVKSRLRSVFQKTGTARQSALVRVLLETLGAV